MTIDPCKDETLLSALLDGELSPEHAMVVRRHVDRCPECRALFETLQQTDGMIREMAPVEPSVDFDRIFWRKVDELEEHGRRRSWLRYALTGWRPVLAAGLAAGLAAVVFIHSGHERKPTREELFITQNMELLQNFDVIEHLDMLEQWDAIETMKEPS